MPYPPPFPLHAPTRLPTVDSGVASKDINALDWFMTPDQEASSDQLRFKVCALAGAGSPRVPSHSRSCMVLGHCHFFAHANCFPSQPLSPPRLRSTAQWRPGVEGAVEKLEAFLSGRLQYFEHDRAKVCGLWWLMLLKLSWLIKQVCALCAGTVMALLWVLVLDQHVLATDVLQEPAPHNRPYDWPTPPCLTSGGPREHEPAVALDPHRNHQRALRVLPGEWSHGRQQTW